MRSVRSEPSGLALGGVVDDVAAVGLDASECVHQQHEHAGEFSLPDAFLDRGVLAIEEPKATAMPRPPASSS